MRTTIKWLIENLPAEVVEQNKILLYGAIDVEKANLHHCWANAQLHQLKADFGKPYEKFDDYYNSLNNDNQQELYDRAIQSISLSDVDKQD